MTAFSDVDALFRRKGPTPNRYQPHQGARECARRLRRGDHIETPRERKQLDEAFKALVDYVPEPE